MRTVHHWIHFLVPSCCGSKSLCNWSAQPTAFDPHYFSSVAFGQPTARKSHRLKSRHEGSLRRCPPCAASKTGYCKFSAADQPISLVVVSIRKGPIRCGSIYLTSHRFGTDNC